LAIEDVDQKYLKITCQRLNFTCATNGQNNNFIVSVLWSYRCQRYKLNQLIDLEMKKSQV